jgi:hypothetical protein
VKAAAIGRIATVLGQVRWNSGRGTAAVVEAPQTPYYVQFAPMRDAIHGEAVGEANLPRLQVHVAGSHIRKQLRLLGWAEPDEDSHGNWTRKWALADWNPPDVARLVVDTFDRAYSLKPGALDAATARYKSARRDPD